MKIFLHSLAKISLRRELSAVGYEQSVESCQPSVLNRHSPTKYPLLPKTYTRIPLLLFILVFFVSCSTALAQESAVHATPAGQAETEITPLKIGDNVPDELWEMYFPIVSANTDQVQYLSLGDYKDKLIILDFWATWCGSCISSLAEMMPIQNDLKDEIMVIPVTYESRQKVNSFLEKNKIDWNYPMIINDQSLRSFFPHRSVPHLIWIKDHKINAITGPEHGSTNDILKVINKEAVILKVKDDRLEFDRNNPKIHHLRDAEIYKETVLSKHIEGIGSQSNFNTGDTSWLSLTNLFIGNMFEMLRPARKVQFDLPDSLRKIVDPMFNIDIDKMDFEQRRDLERQYSQCFVLRINDNIKGYKLFEIAFEEMNNYTRTRYGIQAFRKPVMMDCWVLKIEDPTKLPLSTGGEWIFKKQEGNVDIRNRPISILAGFFPDEIIVNETDFTGKIDIQLDINNISIEEYGNILSKYGLSMYQVKRPINTLIISQFEE